MEGELYFCLEERKVYVSGQEIELTAKEFDALRLLIMNRKRVLTFEMISYQVWVKNAPEAVKHHALECCASDGGPTYDKLKFIGLGLSIQ